MQKSVESFQSVLHLHILIQTVGHSSCSEDAGRSFNKFPFLFHKDFSQNIERMRE